MVTSVHPAPEDRRTRVAVKASYLDTALDVLRKAAAVEDNSEARSELTQATAVVAAAGRAAAQEWADLRQAEIVAAALEG